MGGTLLFWEWQPKPLLIQFQLLVPIKIINNPQWPFFDDDDGMAFSFVSPFLGRRVQITFTRNYYSVHELLLQLTHATLRHSSGQVLLLYLSNS